MDQPTPEPPLPDACRTGRAFITPCCTAGATEYRIDDMRHLAFHVAGHGWCCARPGRIEDINHTGTICDGTGNERRVSWRPDRQEG